MYLIFLARLVIAALEFDVNNNIIIIFLLYIYLGLKFGVSNIFYFQHSFMKLK